MLISWCLKFKARYLELNQATSSSSSTQPATKQSKSGGLKKLIREVLSDSEDDASTNPTTSSGDPSRPWRAEFLGYIETIEASLPAGMSTIQWWGVSSLCYYEIFLLMTILFKINAQRYPVWASLSRDYLSIMSTSVSSERAFSQGGITISKRRNRLKGDIVEALQCVKCSIRHDLLFREPEPSSLMEEELEDLDTNNEDEIGEKLGVDVADNEDAWDTLLLEDDDDYESDFEMELDNN